MPRFAGRIDRDKVRRSSVASRLVSDSSSYPIETPLRTDAQNHASLPLTQTLLADSIASPLDAAISWDGDACPPVAPRTYIVRRRFGVKPLAMALPDFRYKKWLANL